MIKILFHEHNDRTLLEIINKIKNSINSLHSVISDPGYKLIQECVRQSINYTLIPGPSSLINAIVMSGLPVDKFSFFGFMPKKKHDQEELFKNLKNNPSTAIFFESPKRIEKTILNLIKIMGLDKKIAICREMTAS